MELRTPRTLLREFTREDLAGFSHYRLDPRFGVYAEGIDAMPSSVELLEMFLQWAVEEPRRAWQFAITLPTRASISGPLIGTAGLRQRAAGDGVAEFGIELDRRHWRQGLATEVSRGLLDFDFGTLGLREIQARSVSANLAVTRLLETLRFEPDGEADGPEWMQRRGWKERLWRLPA